MDTPRRCLLALPYDNLNAVLNAARIRLNDDVDTTNAVSAQILDNNQFFSQQACNTAWRRMQEVLVSLDYVTLTDQVTLTLAGIPNVDPSIQTYLSWSGYFNGVTLDPSVVLPQTLIAPMEVQERPSGQAASFSDMDLIIGIMPGIPKVDWNVMWQWRNDKLYMPGARQAVDLRVLFASYLADFLDTGDLIGTTGFTPWFAQPVPIMRSLDALASFICAEFQRALGNLDAVVAYTDDGIQSCRMIAGKDTMAERETQKASEYGKMRGRLTPA